MWRHTRRNQISSFGERTSPFKSVGERQFSRLLPAELCASAVVMLDTPCSEVLWRVLATHYIRQFPLHFLPVRHRVPSHFNWSLIPYRGFGTTYGSRLQEPRIQKATLSHSQISGLVKSEISFEISTLLGFSQPFFLKMGPTGCPETSARNHHYCLRNNWEECSSLLIIKNVLVIWYETSC